MSDGLRERVAREIYPIAFDTEFSNATQLVLQGDAYRITDSVLPIIARERAAAWDEGAKWAASNTEHNAFLAIGDNPYRAAGAGAGVSGE